jgi:5-methylcytosine-specific restriction endonuclease McrA
LPCWLCGQAIDYEAPADDPNAFTVDHVKPLSLHPDLAEVESNQRAAHRRCNVGRGNRPPQLDIGEPSRCW